MTYDPTRRRARGPERRPGPRGEVREWSSRCGWCQREDRRPLAERDLRRWRWHPALGAVHGWCLRVARRAGRIAPGSRPARPDPAPEAPRGAPEGARAAWLYPDDAAAPPAPVWYLRPHPTLPLAEVVGRRVRAQNGRQVDPGIGTRWVAARRLSFRTPAQRELRLDGSLSPLRVKVPGAD